jgi:hypothetical protein
MHHAASTNGVSLELNSVIYGGSRVAAYDTLTLPISFACHAAIRLLSSDRRPRWRSRSVDRCTYRALVHAATIRNRPSRWRLHRSTSRFLTPAARTSAVKYGLTKCAAHAESNAYMSIKTTSNFFCNVATSHRCMAERPPHMTHGGTKGDASRSHYLDVGGPLFNQQHVLASERQIRANGGIVGRCPYYFNLPWRGCPTVLSRSRPLSFAAIAHIIKALLPNVWV